MMRRKLGRSGLEVSPLCFGGNVFGWTVDEATSLQLLDAMFAAGINFIDTADVYSKWVPGHTGGESETILGKWLKRSGHRGQVVLATKVGMEMGPGKKGLSRRYIMQAVEDSLKRLQTDHIDLYQSHEDDKATPFEETLEAFQRLIEQGKVRAIGASNYDAARLAGALAASKQRGLPRYESLQPLYNLFDRAAFEHELAGLCVAEDIGVIGYFSLASGFLTGKYRSSADLGKSPRGAGMKKYLNPRGLGILQALDAVAARIRATPAQVALAWLIARPGVTAPIASATSLAQLRELIAAVDITLDQQAIASLNQASG